MEEQQFTADSFRSAEINEISAALSAFQGSIEQPKLEKEVKVKTRSGSEYKFKYADLSACVKSASPVLKEHGLSVSQIIYGEKLITLLSHKSGQWLKSELMLPPPNADYQQFGSAITYLKRYSYCAILGIVADPDDDANMACGNEASMNDIRRNSNNPRIATGTSKAKSESQEPSDEFIEKVISRISGCRTTSDITALYSGLRNQDPQLVANGTKLYNAIAEQSKRIKRGEVS